MPRLSRRENEVARLVGEGLTNRQIAEHLFVSERTAEYHVEQILNKLGFHTRAEIAKWMKAQARAQPSPRHLPLPLTTFVGRLQERAAIGSLLGQTRIVTISGTAGSGKTRLALEVASKLAPDFEHGVWFVDLQSLDDASLLLPEVAAALEVTELERDLAGSHRLIVLDNCEQIASGCRDLVRKLVAVGSGIKVLATSREPLRVEGEGVWVLHPLASAESMDLFVERVRLAAPEMAFGSADRELIHSICADLDGLPLAIELAASRTRLMSLADIRERLDSRFSLLVGGGAASPRQQTLKTAVSWSFDLLAPDEQLLFCRLGIFSGACFLDSVQTVVADHLIPADLVPGLLDSLVERSMVVADRTPARPTRYRLLVTLREYARERLAETKAVETLRAVHARHYRDLAVRAGAELQGPKQATWLTRIEDELDEYRAAFNWSLEHDAESACVIASELGWFWGMRGRVGEGRRALAATLPKMRAPTLIRGRALIMSGWLARLQGDLQASARFHSESIDVLRRFDDPVQLGLALVWNAEAAGALNDWKAARAGWTEAIDLLEPLGTSEPLGYAMLELGLAEINERASSSARDYARKGMSMMVELGNERGLAVGRVVTSYAAYIDGDLDEAWAEITECLASLRRLGALGDLNMPLPVAAIVAVAIGHPEIGVCLGAAHESLRGSTGWVQNLLFDTERRLALDQARAQLGEVAYRKAWERGLAMDADDAVDLVQEQA